MTQTFLMVLNMSLSGAIVILAVMMARLLLWRAPKKWSYLLWLAAAFRLVCPISFRSALSLFALLPQKAAPVAEKTAGGLSSLDYLPAASFAPQNMPLPGGTALPTAVISAVPQQTIPPFTTPTAAAAPLTTAPLTATPTAAPTDAPIGALVTSAPGGTGQSMAGASHVTLAGVLSLVWLLGVLALLIYGIVSYIRLRKRNSTAILLEGSRRVYRSEFVESPFILGLFRPRIYVPYGLEGDALSHVLAHENCHIRRGDHAIKTLAFAILALHWFNPLVWLGFYLMNRDMELSCDEKVLSGAKNAEERKNYARTLLGFAEVKRFPAPNPLAFGESAIKRRIRNAAKWKKPKLIISAIAAALALAVVAACTLNPIKPSNATPTGPVETEQPTDAHTSAPVVTERPTAGPELVRVVQYDAKVRSHFALLSNGQLYTWGENLNGQLGNGEKGWTGEPVCVLDGVTAFYAGLGLGGAQYAFAIKNDGSLWAWGSNTFGQLGDGTVSERLTPVRVLDDVASVDLFCNEHGLNSVFALKNDNSLWGWGENSMGELGTGDCEQRTAPTLLATDVEKLIPEPTTYQVNGLERTIYCLKTDKTLWGWGAHVPASASDGEGYTPVKLLEGIRDAFAFTDEGVNAVGCAISEDNGLYVFGPRYETMFEDYRADGILRRGCVRIMENVREVCGNYIIDNDGALWAWGLNANGELGTGDREPHPVPAKIAGGVQKVMQLKQASFALKEDGILITWGCDRKGGLGLGEDGGTAIESPTELLRGVSDFDLVLFYPEEDPDWPCMIGMAKMEDDSLWTWGYNANNERGVGLDRVGDTVPSKLLDDVRETLIDGRRSYAITNDGRLWTWDHYYSYDIAPAETYLPYEIGTDAEALFEANGEGVPTGAAYLKRSGALHMLPSWQYMLGGQPANQLPEAPSQAPELPAGHSAEGLSVNDYYRSGDSHFALMSDASLFAWGENSHGMLGTGNTAYARTPTCVMENVDKVFLGSNARFIFAVTADGALYGWGENDSGQLGDGTTEERHLPTHIMDGVKEIRVLGRNVFALLDDGSMYGWGANGYGELGVGSTRIEVTPQKVLEHVSVFAYQQGREISSDACAYYAILEDGSLWTWGRGWFGESYVASLTPRHILDDVREVKPGVGICFAITNGGELYAWGGDGTYPMTGSGMVEAELEPVKILDNVRTVEFCDDRDYACYNFFAISENGELWAWGRNDGGALGTGDLEPRTAPVRIAENILEVRADANRMALALTGDGTLLAWGSDVHGALGTGGTQQLTPKAILSNVRSFDVRSSEVLGWNWTATEDTCVTACSAITEDGSLYVWGLNRGNWLGLGNEDGVDVPTKLFEHVAAHEALSTDFLTKDGQLWRWYTFREGGPEAGMELHPQLAIDGVSKRCASGGVIRTDGSLWCWPLMDEGAFALRPDYMIGGMQG